MAGNLKPETKKPLFQLLCTLAQPSWAYYDSRGNVAREDARGTAKSLREFKQERDAAAAAAAAEERSRSNRGRNGEQGRILSGVLEMCCR